MARRLVRLLSAAAMVLAVGLVPYLYAWWSCPADRYFTGLMINVPDHTQYWSWVTASRDGLFISNTMTPEPNPAIFMNPMMWVLAKVQELTGWGFAAMLQFWRVLAATSVVLGLSFAVRTFCVDSQQRRTAFYLVLLGSGFGVIWILVKYVARLGEAPFPLDIFTVESNIFLGLMAYPYLPFSQGLIFTVMAAAWRMHHRGHPRYCALAGAAALALALFHAYDLIPIYATLGLTGLVLWVRDRRFPSRLAIAGGAVAVVSGPVAFYYQRLTATDPLWQQVLSQYVNAGVWTPPHLHLFVLMGLPLALAVYAVAARLVDSDERLFALAWAVCGLVLIYVPVVYQIKFLNGWQLPLAVLAAAAWHERIVPALAAWLRERGMVSLERRWQVWAGALLVAATLPTNLYLFGWRLTEMRRHDAPYFLHVDEKAALDWLAANASPADVVLAPLALGQFVPNYGEARPVVAHWAMTVRFFERRDAAERFFEPSTPVTERSGLIDREAVTLVLRPKPEMREATWAPATALRLALVFDRPRAQVYRVVRDGSRESRP